MLTARDIWAAVDSAARRQGLSASGLARLAGLDATAFNPSKRRTRDGRERWPSTETVARILEAIGETWDQFIYFDEETTELPTEGVTEMDSITVDGITFTRKKGRTNMVVFWQTEPSILGGTVVEYPDGKFLLGTQNFKTLEEACSVSISRQRANIQRMRHEVEMFDRATAEIEKGPE